jgi:hypothetical protein
MQDLNAISQQQQAEAREVLAHTRLIEIWQAIGARVEAVGSFRNGTLIRHLDIDFHIYTDPFSLADSFRAMAELAEVPGMERIEFLNQLSTDEKCTEWHVRYRHTTGRLWTFDLIHLRPDSPYVGHFEKVAEAVRVALTPEIQEAVLRVKHGFPEGESAPGIRVYQAVFQDGVRSHEEFLAWDLSHPEPVDYFWMPKA